MYGWRWIGCVTTLDINADGGHWAAPLTKISEQTAINMSPADMMTRFTRSPLLRDPRRRGMGCAFGCIGKRMAWWSWDHEQVLHAVLADGLSNGHDGRA